MLFPIKVIFYKLLMAVLKVLIKFVPQPPPLLYTGENSALAMSGQIGMLGYRKVLIVTDKVLVGLGVCRGICDSLRSQGIEYVIFDGVMPDPLDTIVQEGSDTYAAQSCDCVLGLGGGSSLDAAKMIAALAAHPNKSVKQLSGILKFKRKAKPLFLVPSTAGTGSEVTAAAVISNSLTHEKMLVVDPKMMAQSAAIDPIIMQGMPPKITAETGIDALTHAIESYVSGHRTAATDAHSEMAIKLLFNNLELCYSNGNNLPARKAVALASTYAGLAFSHANLGYVHAIAHQLGRVYQVPHGLANALVLPHVLDYSEVACRNRFAKLAMLIGLDTQGKNEHQLSLEFIASVRSLLQRLNIPNTLDKLNADDIDSLAKSALKEAHYLYPVPRYMTQKSCQHIIGLLLV